jgi:hypothetical protein
LHHLGQEVKRLGYDATVAIPDSFVKGDFAKGSGNLISKDCHAHAVGRTLAVRALNHGLFSFLRNPQ